MVRLQISTDDQFVVAVLSSGEVVSFRVMDTDAPTHKERAEAIFSQYPTPAAEVISIEISSFVSNSHGFLWH